MTTSEVVLDTIYRRYYLNRQLSDVTSSHWNSVGWQQVRKVVGGWELKGAGFGSRRKDTLLNRLVRWPSTRMTFDLLRERACPEKLIELGIKVANRQGRLFDYDCARQVLTLDLLASQLGEMNDLGRQNFTHTIAVIGDGYGYLASLLGEWLPKATIIEINLGRTLFFDAYYLSRAFPDRRHGMFVEESEPHAAGGFLYLEAESVSKIQSVGAWLYINLSSMQEMDLQVVHDYFRLMRAGRTGTSVFYCCNREEKQLPDGTVTRFRDYGWRTEDEILLDELCPWVQKYPKSFPPQWLPFDGPARHRLVRLASAS